MTMTTAPRGLQSGDRATWFGLYYNISGAGFYLHPVGLELLVDHKALDPARWTVQKVFFQGRYYKSLAQLEEQFEAGLVNVVLIPDNGTGGSWSLKSQASPGPAPPLQFHPQGPRFSVQGSRVSSSLWTFFFGLGAFSGPRIFDIRFQGERLAYEISLQEALAVYGGNSPAAMLTRYIDGSFGMGKYSTPLTRGVDCPYLATYVDWHFLLESQAPKTIQDAFCVFEQNQGLPLRRHHSDMHSHYFGGLAETVLVIRSVSTLLNYDYLWDMVFHPSGAIEVQFHATGYISSAFLFGAGRSYGNQVGEHTLGTVHTHSAHFKVDLDVGGKTSWGRGEVSQGKEGLKCCLYLFWIYGGYAGKEGVRTSTWFWSSCFLFGWVGESWMLNFSQLIGWYTAVGTQPPGPLHMTPSENLGKWRSSGRRQDPGQRGSLCPLPSPALTWGLCQGGSHLFFSSCHSVWPAALAFCRVCLHSAESLALSGQSWNTPGWTFSRDMDPPPS